MNLPAVQDYVKAFLVVLPKAPQSWRDMLSAHVRAPQREMTATQLAEAAGYQRYSAANANYGKLARKLCEHLCFSPPVGNSGQPTPTYILARSRKNNGEDWIWTLHEEVAAALREVEAAPLSSAIDSMHPVFPDEVPDGEYIEGAVVQRLVNARERDQGARDVCIEYWGTSCLVCELDANEIYGVDARRFIHVHHLRPLSSLATAEATDPIKDLRPVCPSCHAALHFRSPPISIDELRSQMRQLRRLRGESQQPASDVSN